MKNKLKKSLSINLLITIITSVLSFVSNKYFTRYMGMETLGLMKLFTQLIAYINLADMGIGTASSYALYKPLAEKNINRINIVVSTIDYFYKRIAFLILGIGLFLNLFLKYFIEVNDYGKMLYIYWSLYILNTAISYVYARYSILFTANQEFDWVRIVQGTGKIIFGIAQVVFLIKIQSFLLFIIIMILENVYNYLFFRVHYKKKYKIEKVREIDKDMIKDVKNLFWHKLATVIVFNTDYIVLSKFTNLMTIGLYSSYLMIYQMLMTLVGIISGVLTPNIGKFVAQNSKDRIFKKWNQIYVIYFYMSTILVVSTYYLITPFIKIWLGAEYSLPSLTVLLILFNLFIQMTRGVTETFKTVSGFFDDTYAPFLESGINLVFSLILVQKIGLDGVIIGTIISNVVVILILKPILVFRRCFDKKGRDYIKIFGQYFLMSGASLFITNFLITKVFSLNLKNIDGWITWMIKAVVVGLITLLVTTLIFIFNKMFRMNLIKR